MANLKIYGIIEKMTSKDRESRYMATSDLLNELNEDSLKLGTGLEMILRSIIPQQLDDVAGDVSGLAVKCLALLGKKVGEERIVEMTINLCDELLHMEDWYHDTASIALRAVVSQVASSLSPDIPFTLTPKMIEGICGQGMGTGIKCGCLSIMTDIVQKYASLMADGHDKLLNTLLVQLCCNNATVWKKTVTRIASLACSLSDDLLAKATVEVFENLSNKNAKSEITRTNIQMIEDFCHAVGYQLVAHQGSLVPVLAKYYLRGSASDEELCKSSLQALQSFLLRCPFSTYCHKILDLALEYLTYDDTSNEYTDVFSWGVRRAATKCLRVLIVSHPEMLSKLYQEACPKLIDRFKERDKKLKMDVFNTFIALLRQTAIVTKGQTETDESSPKWLLEQEVSKIVNSITEQLREINSVKTKVGAFSVLRELVAVLPDCLGSLVPVIERALNDKSSTSDLKIEALVFTKLILASHAPPVFHPYIKALSSPVLAAVGERYYKVTAEALRVCKELVRVIRPNTAGMGFDFKPFVHPIYNAIMLRLTNKDQDQEVKECAITCMGLVISTFGDQLRAELSSCLPVLVDHMGNENTRLTAVKAFAVIATSPLLIDISCVLDHLIAQLTGFLRKANWALGQATLVTMNTLVTAYGDKIGLDAYEAILVELSPLISVPNVPDMYMSALALKLCCTLMTGKSASENISLAVRNKVLPQALTLVKSPLLQGQALLDLKKFFEALVCHANTSFYTLLDSLVSCAMDSPESGGVPKQALYSIAQCVAVLCLATGDQNDSYTVKMLMEILKNATEKRRLNDLLQEKQQLKDRLQTRQHLKDPFKPKQHLKDPLEAKQHLALLSLGEIGRRKDLSAHAGIETIVIESFQSPFEEIKSAASYALGNIAVGNLAKYLPFILNRIDIQQKNQYFLLHSLKKVIVRQSVDKADFQNSSVEKILALLFNHCDNEDEGVRDVVAQCLGKMALIEPEKLVPALLVRTTSSAAFTRATVVTAVKYSLVEQPEKLDEIIFPEIISFLILMQDGDRHVRRAAVSALSTFARYKPNLIKGILPQLLPLLYDHTFLKKELIRTANLGPFKHVVDDGLELRKAAFECVFTLRHSCLDLVNLPFLKSGQEVEEESKVVVSDLVEFQFGGGDVEALVVYAIQLEEALMHLPILTSVTFYGHSLRSFNVNFEPHGSRIDDVPLRIDVPLAFPEEPPAVRCLTEFHGPFHLRDDGSVILDWSPGMPLSSVISELFKIWFL